MAKQDQIKLLRQRRKVEKEITDLKRISRDLTNEELTQLKVLEDRKRRIAKLERTAQADREKAEYKFIGIQSKVSTFQDEIGKKTIQWTKNGSKEVFKFSNAFKLATSNMQPMIQGGVQMTKTYTSIAKLMKDIAASSELAENYLGGGSKQMQATTTALSSQVEMYEEWASGIIKGKETTTVDPTTGEETVTKGKDQKASTESTDRGKEMLPKMMRMSDMFDASITQIGSGLTNINDLQTQNITSTLEMATQWDKMGTSGFTVSVDKAQELYDLSVKQAKITKLEIKSGKKKLGLLQKEMDVLVPGTQIYEDMSKSIEQMELDLEEMNIAAETSIKTGEQNLANADRMRQMNNQIGASMDYILAPHEKLKSVMESLPFGKMISSFVDLEGLGSTFGNTVQKNLVGMFSEPTVALEEYETKSGDMAKRFRNIKTGQLVAADDDSVLTLNDMDSTLDNIMGGAQDYANKLQEGFDFIKNMDFGGMLKGLKAVTMQAWQFVKAALANPYVAAAAAIALIGVLLYKAMNYAEAMRQEFGITRGEAFEIQTAVDATAMQFKLLGVSAEDVGTMAQGIADNMGGVSNITQENLAAMAELQGLYGMSADSIAPAMTAMKGLGAESNEAASAQLAQIGHMAQMEGVAPAKVFADMTADMGTFSRFGKEGGKNLAEAAIMARKLGTSLESMAATSDALLDFESNINDQMEASMLLGRSINMDKARELALAGDIAGQEREILKQIGTQAQWEKMNVVQRDALAKATGKSTQDLSTMLANQANLNSMTDKERANKEAMQKSDEKMNAGMEAAGKEMGNAWSAIMAPLKEVMMAVQPLFGLLMKIIGFALKPIVLQFKLIGFIIKPIIKVLGFVLGIITDISTWIENGIGKVWESIKPTIMTIGKILAVVLFPPIALMVGVVKLIMHYWEDIKGVLLSVGGFIWKLLIAPIKTLWSIMQFGFGLIASMGKMIFNALITPFQMLWSGIKAGFAMWVSLIKAPFNLIIAGVNMVINAINSLSVKVPDWVPFIGGKEFGFNLPNVPSLATEAGGPGHNVKETGIAEVHKGESVGTFDMSQTNSKLDELIQLLGQSGPIAVGVGGVKSNTKSISDQIV